MKTSNENRRNGTSPAQAPAVPRRRLSTLHRLALVTGGFLSTWSTAIMGCGQQHFVVTSSAQAQKAPGSFNIPPRVDILMVVDDTGSMSEIYSAIKQQLPAFLQALDAKEWDYHFATAALTRDRVMTQVAASKHDPSWGNEWVPPFPGATMSMIAGAVNPSHFRKASEYNQFVSSGFSNDLNGKEPGFENLVQTLYSSADGTGFLRNDAMLAIIVFGNGEDTSGVTFCDRRDRIIGNGNDEYIDKCEKVGYPQYGTDASSFAYYKNQLLGLKPGKPSQVKLFAAVAHQRMLVSAQNPKGCRGGNSWIGDRYIRMSQDLGGSAYTIDICSQDVASALDALAGNLAAEKRALRTRYLFLEREPDPSTIVVKKYIDGRADQETILPQGKDNGWTYEGYVENVFVIDSPVEMNQASGYAVRLHGSARLSGDDTAIVDYKPAGAKDSASRVR